MHKLALPTLQPRRLNPVPPRLLPTRACSAAAACSKPTDLDSALCQIIRAAFPITVHIYPAMSPISCNLSPARDVRVGSINQGMVVQVPAYVPYSGRPPSASPATGFSDVHKKEQESLCANAMNLDYA